jgi:hypothetical protein
VNAPSEGELTITGTIIGANGHRTRRTVRFAELVGAVDHAGDVRLTLPKISAGKRRFGRRVATMTLLLKVTFIPSGTTQAITSERTITLR